MRAPFFGTYRRKVVITKPAIPAKAPIHPRRGVWCKVGRMGFRPRGNDKGLLSIRKVRDTAAQGS